MCGSDVDAPPTVGECCVDHGNDKFDEFGADAMRVTC